MMQPPRARNFDQKARSFIQDKDIHGAARMTFTAGGDRQSRSVGEWYKFTVPLNVSHSAPDPPGAAATADLADGSPGRVCH
jgi:hypothetical protein